MMWALLGLLACSGGSGEPGTGTGGAPDDSGGGDEDDTGAQDTGTEPLADVDVVVIGAGPAGLAAAWEVRLGGGSVVVLEATDAAGAGGRWATNFYAVGTAQQQAEGIDDSVEIALSEWTGFTGASAEDPVLEAFLTESAETLGWLETEFGVSFPFKPSTDAGGGATNRLHRADMVEGEGTVAGLVDELSADTWLSSPADALVVDDGAVVGVALTDDLTGEAGWVRASQVVVATGGFGRDLAAVAEHRPGLSELGLLFEIHPEATGGGRELLSAVGADTHNEGGVGVYVHAVPDWREGLEGEAVWLGSSVTTGIWVDARGERLMSEEEATGFAASHVLETLDEPVIYALISGSLFEADVHRIAPYNLTEDDPQSFFKAQDLLDGGVAWRMAGVEPAVEEFGFDEATLSATIARYQELVEAGEDADFGKSAGRLQAFEDDLFYVVPLRPSTTKCFTGVALDEEGRVLDEAGVAIPGLWGAGEAAGMLGVDAVGIGFSGSITAVYWSGRRAGQGALAAAR